MALGSLGIELYASSARLEGDMGRAAQIVESRARAMDQAAARAAKSIEGVGAAAGTIRRVDGIREAANDMQHFGHTTTAARRELLVLAHELSQGNYKKFGGSLMVLGEQMDWMGKIMSPVGLTVGLLTGAVALAATAFIKGAHESAAFRNSIQLTGNYAGVTEGQFNAMAQSIANDSNVTIHTSREMTQAMVSSGRFSGAALESVTMAAIRLAELTGAKTEEVVKDMEKMSNGVLKWAVEANKQYHFVDGALYDHIKRLEEQGRAEEAALVASKAFYDHLGGESVKNLGYLEAAWKGVKSWASSAWDAMLGVGRTATLDDKIGQITSQLEALPKSGIMGGVHQPGDDPRARLQAALSAAVKEKLRAEDNALLESQRARHNDQVVEAKQFWDRMESTHHTGAEELKRRLDEVDRQGTLAGASPADIAAMKAKIEKEFAPKKGSTAGIERADLTSQLKPLQDQITAEDKLLKYRETVLQRAYKDDQVSIQGFYDTRRTIIEANIARTSELYDREIAITEAAAARSKDARTRIELTTKANELRDKRQQALLDSGEQLALMTEAQARDTETYRQEVVKLTAELDKLNHTQSNSAGAEFDRTHRNIASQAKVAGDSDALQTLANARAAAIAQAEMNNLKEKAQIIEANLAITEKRINLQTQTGQQSDLQGMINISDARAASIAQLQAVADQMTTIANTSGLSALSTEADQFKLKVDELKASSDVLGKTFNDIFASAFSRLIENAASGTKSLKQNFLDMANSIEQAMLRLIAQDFANRLLGSSTSSGTGGGIIGQLIKMFSAAGGSSDAGSAAGDGVQVGGAMDMSMPVASELAAGGPAARGTLNRVNENGPELLSVANRTYLMMGNEGGRVTPLQSGAAMSQGHTFNLSVNVPETTERRSALQIATATSQQLQRATRRNG